MAHGSQYIPSNTEQDSARNFLGTGQCTQCSRSYSLDQSFYECFECRVSLCFDCYQTRHNLDHVASVVLVRYQRPSSSDPLCCRLCWNKSTCCYACDECNLVVCRGCWHFRFNAKMHQHRFYSVTETSLLAPLEIQGISHQSHELFSQESQARKLDSSNQLDNPTVSLLASPPYSPFGNPSMSTARINTPNLTNTSGVKAAQYMPQMPPLDTRQGSNMLQDPTQNSFARDSPIHQTFSTEQDYSPSVESSYEQSHVSHPLYQTISTPSAAQMPTPGDDGATRGAVEPAQQSLTPEFARRLSLHRSHSRSDAPPSQRQTKTKRQPSFGGIRTTASGRDSPISDSGRIIKRPSSRTSNASSYAIETLRRHSVHALNTPQSIVGMGSPQDIYTSADMQTLSAASNPAAVFNTFDSPASTTSPEADLMSTTNTAFPIDQTWTTDGIAVIPPTTQPTQQQQEKDLEAPVTVQPAAQAATEQSTTYLQLAQAQLQREHAYAKIQAQARAQTMQAAEAAAVAAAVSAAESAKTAKDPAVAGAAKTAKQSAAASRASTKAQATKATEDEGDQQQGQQQQVQQQEQQQQQQQEGNMTLQQRMSLLTSEAQLNWAAIAAFANMPVGL